MSITQAESDCPPRAGFRRRRSNMDKTLEARLITSLDSAESASAAAQKAIDARDIDAAPALITETLLYTLEAMSLAAQCGKLEVLASLAPSVGFYVHALGTIAEGKNTLEEVAGLMRGSSKDGTGFRCHNFDAGTVTIHVERVSVEELAATFEESLLRNLGILVAEYDAVNNGPTVNVSVGAVRDMLKTVAANLAEGLRDRVTP